VREDEQEGPMLAKNPTGQGAASRKYDILTALGAMGCAARKHDQKLVLRLMTLVTARYNWQRDEICVGRADLARLWCVDERSVKRDLAKLKERRWLTIRRPPARGRVTVYGLNWPQILVCSRDVWPNVGADFVHRMAPQLPESNIVPVQFGRHVSEEPEHDSGEQTTREGTPTGWARVRHLLQLNEPTLFANWVADLRLIDASDGRLALEAPTRFIADYVATHLSEKILATANASDLRVVALRISARR
jgi:hypothetical protein